MVCEHSERLDLGEMESVLCPSDVLQVWVQESAYVEIEEKTAYQPSRSILHKWERCTSGTFVKHSEKGG